MNLTEKFTFLFLYFCPLFPISKFTCEKSVTVENEKSLKTLSTPILGIVSMPSDIDIGLNFTCVEGLAIQSMFISKFG
jgi:hypothetical protein